MRLDIRSNLLASLGAAAVAAAGAIPATAVLFVPALAPAAEAPQAVATDDLPAYANTELEEAREALAADEEAAPAQAQELQAYGASIPDPQDVVSGRSRPIARHPAPQAQAAAAPVPPPQGVDFEDFYGGLSPYGRWTLTPEYGWVFIPARQVQVSDWRPYLYGQWEWTSYGWTWVSEEPFGWATYHYGRWSHSATLGWMWVPGYTWGPAWVAWRFGDVSIGWAPLYPGYVTYTASYPVHVDHWIFVGNSFFCGHPIHRNWYRGRGHYYYSRSRWARNWREGGRGHVFAGPPRHYVERRTHRRILESRLVAVGRPDRHGYAHGLKGARGEVRIYRPDNRGAVRHRSAPRGWQRGRGHARHGHAGSGFDARVLPVATRERLRGGHHGSSESHGVHGPSRSRGGSSHDIVRPARPGHGAASRGHGGKTVTRPAPSRSVPKPGWRVHRPSSRSNSPKRPPAHRKASPARGSAQPSAPHGGQRSGSAHKPAPSSRWKFSRPSQRSGAPSRPAPRRAASPAPSHHEAVRPPRVAPRRSRAPSSTRSLGGFMRHGSSSGHSSSDGDERDDGRRSGHARPRGHAPRLRMPARGSSHPSGHGAPRGGKHH